jgi:hypothetical protein
LAEKERENIAAIKHAIEIASICRGEGCRGVM